MASIRRTLSPVPRPGTLLNGEVCSVASPLSKSSSTPQNHSSSSGLLSSLFTSLDNQALVLSVFSPRSSRSTEKSKPRGQIWRRMLFNFFICFVVGVLIGFTPFASMNLSANLMSKHQAFHFQEISTVENFQLNHNETGNFLSLEGGNNMTTNLTEAIETIPVHLISEDKNQSVTQEPNLESQKLLIIVTPTSSQPLQAYYLNRLAHTLKLVTPPLLWIVVEMNSQSVETADVLRRTGIMYRHLVCDKNVTDLIDERVYQRNLALSHIETHRLDGITYFADESNIYLADLFQQMRQIRRFGTWKVAKLSEENRRTMLEGPICNGSQVVGWKISDSRMRFRRFHAELSGFAFNSTILWVPKRWQRPTLEPIRLVDTIKDGFQASTFIEQIVEDESQMEGLLQDCSEVMVWSLHIISSNLVYPKKWIIMNNLDVVASVT